MKGIIVIFFKDDVLARTGIKRCFTVVTRKLWFFVCIVVGFRAGCIYSNNVRTLNIGGKIISFLVSLVKFIFCY